jgi:hypothetical protein
MGGSAIILGLAHMIMAAKLKARSPSPPSPDGALLLAHTPNPKPPARDRPAAHQVHPGGAARLTGPLRAQVKLVVLLSAVENAISGGAFRPGDVLTARNGMTRCCAAPRAAAGPARGTPEPGRAAAR